MFFVADAAAAPQGGMGIVSLLLVYAAIFGVFWFLLIRPQRKKQKQVEEMQKNIAVGDWVMTTGGLYGKVVDTVNDYLIVEFGTNRGIKIPVQRDQVAAGKEPNLTRVVEDEEE